MDWLPGDGDLRDCGVENALSAKDTAMWIDLFAGEQKAALPAGRKILWKGWPFAERWMDHRGKESPPQAFC